MDSELGVERDERVPGRRLQVFFEDGEPDQGGS